MQYGINRTKASVKSEKSYTQNRPQKRSTITIYLLSLNHWYHNGNAQWKMRPVPTKRTTEGNRESAQVRPDRSTAAKRKTLKKSLP